MRKLMIKSLTIIVFGVLLCTLNNRNASAEIFEINETTIPDESIRRDVIEDYIYNVEGYKAHEDAMKKINKLILSYVINTDNIKEFEIKPEYTDLTGIERFTNINYLSIATLLDVDLSMYPELKTLRIEAYHGKPLHFNENRKLKKLTIGDYDVSCIDFSELINLEKLRLYYDKVSKKKLESLSRLKDYKTGIGLRIKKKLSAGKVDRNEKKKMYYSSADNKVVFKDKKTKVTKIKTGGRLYGLSVLKYNKKYNSLVLYDNGDKYEQSEYNHNVYKHTYNIKSKKGTRKLIGNSVDYFEQFDSYCYSNNANDNRLYILSDTEVQPASIYGKLWLPLYYSDNDLKNVNCVDVGKMIQPYVYEMVTNQIKGYIVEEAFLDNPAATILMLSCSMKG